jgi:hypothetical protein
VFVRSGDAILLMNVLTLKYIKLVQGISCHYKDHPNVMWVERNHDYFVVNTIVDDKKTSYIRKYDMIYQRIAEFI